MEGSGMEGSGSCHRMDAGKVGNKWLGPKSVTTGELRYPRPSTEDIRNVIPETHETKKHLIEKKLASCFLIYR